MLRVVLYAEGSRELSTSIPNPHALLRDDQLGPAHLLVRRVLCEERELSQGDVVYEGPLRVRGRPARGSDLARESTLKTLVQWAQPRLRPDLAVVLVDADGDNQRAQRLQTSVSGLIAHVVIGVAVQEFEAWLIADYETVSSSLGMTTAATRRPESMSPAEAKAQWANWSSASTMTTSDEHARRLVADTLRLEVVRGRCAAFERFSRALR